MTPTADLSPPPSTRASSLRFDEDAPFAGEAALAGERGAALVEFALVLPVFLMLVLGMFSGGVVYNQRSSIADAAREGARYGATLPKTQFASSSAWLTAVRDTVVARAVGDLDVPGATVCVAIVSGTASPPAVSGAFSTNAGRACYDDGSADPSERVQVSVRRPGRIEALVFTRQVTLGADTTARYEG